MPGDPLCGNHPGDDGIGESILVGILAEMGDITRFEAAKEILKLSRLELEAYRSGKAAERYQA